jgi:hypothetical protein
MPQLCRFPARLCGLRFFGLCRPVLPLPKTSPSRRFRLRHGVNFDRSNLSKILKNKI